MNQVATQQPRSEIAALREQMSRMGSEFTAALPKHIPAERFQRVAMTAINRNPELVVADRKSLIEACMLAAQDGLLPDGREAALVIFNTKVSKRGGPDQWIKRVQYMPMVAGIRKKVYQSGEIKGLTARIVYENDEFEIAYGDEERISHKPNLFNRGRMIAVYAVATYRDGSTEFEVMTIEDIEKVRSISRSAESGPWRDWYEEMAKKTVIRRLSKNLPISADLNDFLRRDDSFYEVNRRPTLVHATDAPVQPRTIESRLDAFAEPEPEFEDPAEARPHHAEAGSEVSSPQEEPSQESASVQASSPADADSDSLPDNIRDAMAKGRGARRSGYSREVPRVFAYKSKQPEAEAFLRGWDEENNDMIAEQGATV